MLDAERRIDGYLVCGGKSRDFDFARLQVLELLAADDHVRVRVAQHFGDLDAITASEFLVLAAAQLATSCSRRTANGSAPTPSTTFTSGCS